jgi:tetratricopeptide (TPR) repeat protein
MSTGCTLISPNCVKRAYAAALALVVLLVSGCSRKSANDYLTAGDDAMHNGRLAEAESDYRQASTLAPDNPLVHQALGNLYLFEHKASQAETELMKALELAPTDAKTHDLLAKAYVARSELGLAEAQGRAAVALAPANPDYRLNLGATLQSEQKTAAAEAEYRTAIGLQPRSAHAHLALANLLSSEPNRQNEAEAEYARVKVLDPTLVPAIASATPSPRAATTPIAAAGPQVPAIKEINKRFLLTHDSPVYESMSQASRVVAQVHRRKYVHVTGFGGQWLRIQLRNGTIGFIPVTAAE